jgi:predicted Zn-dependent peptidase
MSRLGKGELVYGELMTVEEILGSIDAVTLDDTNALAAALLAHPDSLAVIGPYDENVTEFAA